MGCDAYADENGEFKLEVRKYGDNTVIAVVEVKNLEPNERIETELHKGEWR